MSSCIHVGVDLVFGYCRNGAWVVLHLSCSFSVLSLRAGFIASVLSVAGVFLMFSIAVLHYSLPRLIEGVC